MANNFYIDNNNIKIILYIKLFLKSLRLIFLVFNFSFFIGMGWILMCKCYEDWFNAEYENLHDHFLKFDKKDKLIVHNTFITHNELYEEKYTNWEVLLISVYFSFTSLTTVGFGDYVPLADHERLIGAGMLLFGVLIFSYIMGKFLEMVD